MKTSVLIALGALVATTATTASVELASARAVTSVDPTLHITVDLSERKLVVHDGDDSTITFGVAVGKDSKPTPPGDYTIRRMVWNPAWIPPDQPWAKGKKPQAPGAAANPMKIVKIFFKEPDYYIHGTNEPESIGEAESHGCLRMDPDDAYRLARYLMEHSGAPRSDSWFYRVLHFRSETQNVYLGTPVSLTISD